MLLCVLFGVWLQAGSPCSFLSLFHTVQYWSGAHGVTECAGEVLSALEIEDSPGAETQEFLAGTSS